MHTRPDSGLRNILRGLFVQALEARRLERQWRERVLAFAESLEKQKEDTRDVKSDMLRQYKVRKKVDSNCIHD